MERLNQAELKDWLGHPGTIQFFADVAEDREIALQRMAAGLFSEEPGKQNILIGMVNALTKLLETQRGDKYDE